MRILAFELSARRAGIALLDDDRVTAEETWEEPHARHQELFAAVPRLLQATGADTAYIDAYAIGRGPGSYSGIRVALTAANLFALPHGKQVLAVSSGDSIAAAALRLRPAPQVAVAGDARRGQLWFRLYDDAGDAVKGLGAWELIKADELAARLPEGAVLASPDRDRLLAQHPAAAAAPGWIAENVYPAAADIGRIARRRLAGHLPMEPLEPLYMHPAV